MVAAPILDRQGAVIGYEIILSVAEDGRIRTDGYVHPNYMNQGVGTQLLHWAEVRAREHLRSLPADARVRLLVGIYGDNAASLDLLQQDALQSTAKFFGLTFAPRTDVPVYHPDVRVWEVSGPDGRHVFPDLAA